MKTAVCWLMVSIALLAWGTSTIDQLLIHNDTLQVRKINLWGIRSDTVYKQPLHQITGVEVNFSPPGSTRSLLRYEIVIRDTAGKAPPLPQSISKIRKVQVERVTELFERGIKQNNLKQVGFPHRIPLYLGSIAIFLAILYAADSARRSRRKTQTK